MLLVKHIGSIRYDAKMTHIDDWLDMHCELITDHRLTIK